MSIVGGKECACKGIRTCLVCEKSKTFDIGTVGTMKDALPCKRLYYCPSCEMCYEGRPWRNCTDHEGSADGLLLQGVTLIKDFVDEEEEAHLVEEIQETPWRDSQSGRRKQDYGPKVNFKKKKIQSSVFSGLPAYSKYLVERMWKLPVLSDFIPVELCNLDYNPDKGAAIDPHFDDFWLWGNRLVTLNLLSDTFYTMTSSEYPDIECAIHLEKRTLVVLNGDARTKFMHAIKREDITEQRLGITVRELSAEFAAGGAREEVGKPVIETALGFKGKAVGSVERNGQSNVSNSNNSKAVKNIKSSDLKVGKGLETQHKTGTVAGIESNVHCATNTNSNSEINKSLENNDHTNTAAASAVEENVIGNLTMNEKFKSLKIHSKKMESDGFQRVSKKKGGKSKKPSKESIEFTKDVNQTLLSQNGTKSVYQILASVRKCVDDFERDRFLDVFLEVVPEGVACVVAYGIGCFGACYKARYQLGLLVAVKEKLNLECFVYDPVWSDVEKQVLEMLGFSVIEKNERGCRCVDRSTLFVLAHCPRHLINNILWANWLPDALPNVHIVCNNFDEISSLPQHLTKDDSTYIMKVLPYSASKDIPNSFHCSDVFNNFAINSFPQEMVLKADSCFWSECDMPVYPEDQELNAVPSSS